MEKKTKLDLKMYSAIENRDVLIKMLGLGQLVVKRPMQKHASKFKAAFYEIIHVIYDGDKVVKNWFCCSRCSKLFNIDRNEIGTNQLRRHADNENNVCFVPNEPSLKKNLLGVSREDFSKAFSEACHIGQSIGLVSKNEVAESLPQNLHENM